VTHQYTQVTESCLLVPDAVGYGCGLVCVAFSCS